MRILQFYTPHYRNLHDIGIAFALDPENSDDDKGSIRFLVGPNGSGKTNLLKFLAAIFAALRDEYTGFRPDNPAYTEPYYLVYQLRGNTITIAHQGMGNLWLRVLPSHLTTAEQAIYYVRGKVTDAPEGSQDGLPGTDTLVPQMVLIYSSGDVTSWQRLINATQLAEPLPLSYLEAIPGDELDPEDLRDEEETTRNGTKHIFSERVLLVRPDYLPAALLAAFIQYYSQTINPAETRFEKTLDNVQFDTLLTFSLHIRPPQDDVSDFSRAALTSIANEATLRLKNWGKTGTHELYVFDVVEGGEAENVATRLLARLAGEGEGEPITAFQLFLTLIALLEEGVLQQIDLIINKRHPERDDRHTVLVTDLSDGERALLQRMALISLLANGENLFLFDEPEVHFNDTWKRNLVDHIERSLEAVQSNSEVILTTHSSITLTDAYAYEVIRLGYTGQQNVPLTFGTEPGEILQQVYGARADVGERALRKIEEAEVAGNREQLEELLKQMGPGYQRFRVVSSLEEGGEDATSD